MLEKLMPEIGPNPVPDLMWLSCDGMMVIDEQRRILAMNPALEQLIGRPSSELAGKSECGLLFSCRDLQGCSLEDQPERCPGLKAMVQFEPVRDAQFTIRNAQGKGIVVSASYTPIQLPDRPVWALAVFRDVTLNKKQELRWIQQAMTDPLTALPNRTALLDRLQKELSRTRRYRRPLAVAIADLDGFKGYNDAYGHPAGDELLQALAQLFQAGRRSADLIARYGGDEFALLLPETDFAGAEVVTEHLRGVVASFPFPRRKPLFMKPDLTHPVRMSFGVAVFPEDGTDPKDLIACADERLYEAKRRGGNCVVEGPLLEKSA